jgi:nitrogen-specific signal transduction histidine kinase
VPKKSTGAFNIDSVKDPELRGYVQHLTNSLTRQNQELKIQTLKNNILEEYFHSSDLQKSLMKIAREFIMPGCSSLRILIHQKTLFGLQKNFQTAVGNFAEEYAYLDEQIINQLKDKERLIVQDTTKIHSIKFTPEHRYPKTIAALKFLQSEAVDGYLWISFEAVKEFIDFELENLDRFGEVLGWICANGVALKDSKMAADAFEEMLAIVAAPVILVNKEKKILYSNPAADTAFKGMDLSEVCLQPPMIDWLNSNNGQIEIEEEIGDRHYLVNGRKLADNDWAVILFEDDTSFNRKQAYLALMMDTINHDFRSTLVNLQGFSKLLGMVGEMNTKQSEYLQLIREGIGEIETVTTDLLDVNRMIQEGGLKVQDCSPGELVDKAVSLVQAEARQKQVRFEKQLKTTDQSVCVDRIMVISALYQLLKQAVANSHLGGTVYIAEEVTGATWHLTIRDEGRGISQIDVEKIAANHFTDKDVPGLSLVYRIARFHNGEFRLESELGKGTKYILQLPCCG